MSLRRGAAPQMSDSYPTVQDELSPTQKEFMGCVEMHLDPPDHTSPTYAVEALYRCDDAVADALPGETVRFSLSVNEDDSEIATRDHAVEFVDAAGEPRGWVRHHLKRVEAGNSRFFWTESQFEVVAPGIPQRQARHAEVEREVQLFVDKIRRLDHQRRLVELRTV